LLHLLWFCCLLSRLFSIDALRALWIGWFGGRLCIVLGFSGSSCVVQSHMLSCSLSKPFQGWFAVTWSLWLVPCLWGVGAWFHDIHCQFLFVLHACIYSYETVSSVPGFQIVASMLLINMWLVYSFSECCLGHGFLSVLQFYLVSVKLDDFQNGAFCLFDQLLVQITELFQPEAVNFI
jgi:hypothetical protein